MWIEVHNTSIRSNGSLKHFLGIWTDITQRKKIEESLRESEKKHKETSTLLSSILSQMSDYIFLIDEDYTTRFINKATREVYGAAEGEKCYKAFRKLDRPCYHADVLCEVHELLHKSKDYFEDIRQTGPKITHLRSTPTVTSDGKRAILTVSRDVTEQKKAEEKLRQMERLTTIGETAAMVGHDIRNPLQGIAGAAHYLKHHTDTERNVKAKEMLEIIDQSITNADKIVNDLLDYAREIWLESIDANLQRLIRAALDLARVPENIQVTDLTESSLRITVDPEKIRRLFVNLIKNAVDAMPEGGKLTITSKESNGNIEISITDTGAGMTKETMEKLWTPLFTTKPRGMGFGLAICKRIAEAHGGTITAESRVNEGSTLTVKLPLQQRKTEES